MSSERVLELRRAISDKSKSDARCRKKRRKKVSIKSKLIESRPANQPANQPTIIKRNIKIEEENVCTHSPPLPLIILVLDAHHDFRRGYLVTYTPQNRPHRDAVSRSTIIDEGARNRYNSPDCCAPASCVWNDGSGSSRRARRENSSCI
jgi:hypothetical protein